MKHQQNTIFLHGLEGSSKGFKATFLRNLFPDILIPDFDGSLEQRMAQLIPLLSQSTDWIIVGSSFGGLMGTLYTVQKPEQVRKLILLAPALTRPFFADDLPDPISTPTLIYHGQHDTVVPLEQTRTIAEKVFRTLFFHIVEDDHALHATVQTLDWATLLERNTPAP